MALPLTYNVRNLRVRWRVTLLAIFGIALVVAVFITLIALASGLRIALRATGSGENAIAVQRGATGELVSGIPAETARVLSVDDRVARDESGQPLASPEIVIIITLPRKADGALTNVQFRGVSPMAFKVRNNVRITNGRAVRPGLAEVIVGERLLDRFSGLDIGSQIHVKGRDWTVVGTFTADGSSFESEVWADVDVVASAFNRMGGYQSLTMRMNDPGQIEAFNRMVQGDPRLQVDIKGERQFYEDQAGPIGNALTGLAIFVSVVMGIGAVFGAMNTMYAVVAARTREIGTLRALGFSRFAILLAFIIESVCIAIVAGALGVLLALPANGLTAATGNVTFAELAFAFRITPPAIAAGLVFAVVMGFFGGLLPALRAARLPIISALRSA